LSIQDEIFEWVQQFDPWKQELFIRAAAAPELPLKDAEEIAAMLLGEQDQAARPREIKRADLPESETADHPMTIARITELRNVNAIDEGQTLGFAPRGVNAVWGANGAGKTGYCRVLKKAGRTLYQEEVLTNVYADSQGSPSATVVVEIDGKESPEKLNLDDEPPASLARICVADSHAGEIYLTEETEVDYVPTTLASITRLANGLDAVKAVVKQRRDAVELPDIDVRQFGVGTRVTSLLASLAADSSTGEIRALASLSPEEEEQRADLRKRVGEIEAMQSPQLRQKAEREVDEACRLRNDLRVVAGSLSAEAITQGAELERSLREAREAADLAARALEDQPLSEIGSDPWRLLWKTARDYAAHLGQSLPPDHDPAHCPLCMQELDQAARERLRSFNRFVTDEVNARLDRLQIKKREAVELLPDISAVGERHRGTIELLRKEESGLGNSISSWLKAAEVGLERFRSGEFEDFQPLASPPDLELWIGGREGEAKRQKEIEAGAENAKVRLELAELDDRHRLGERLDEVLGRAAGLRELDRLGQAMSQTGTGTVSLKIRSLSQELIQGGLEEALKRQLEALEFRGIEVVPKTRIVRGQPVTGLAFKSVEGVPLTAVLSQGEQRRLSLAMFLAEMEVRSEESPIVLDDPTSSIDQEGRRRIARTLLKLGEERQVIVFTHELSLIFELQRHATSARRLSAQHVMRVGKTAGHVQPSLPWQGLSPRDRLGDLDQKLVKLRKEYEKQDLENYAMQAGHYCNLLRSSFERAVEDQVLGGVVTRRADDVRTKQLRTINWSEEICDLVDQGMSDNSPWVHDQPLPDGALPPGPDELEEGLNIYKELLDKTGEIKKRREKEAATRKKERVAQLKAVPLAPTSGEAAEKGDLKVVPDLEPGPAADISPVQSNREPATDQLETE